MTTTSTFPQRRTLGVLAASQVVGGVGNGAGLSVGALLVREVSGSAGWAGTATVALTLGAAAATVPLATLAAHRGRRPALALGWLVGAVGAALVVTGSAGGSLALALAGLVLFGVSTAASLQARFAATDRSDGPSVGRDLSLVVWAMTIGAVAGPNLTGPGAAAGRALAIPEIAGPMLFSLAAFALAGLLTAVGLRPDPLPARDAAAPPPVRIRAALPHVRGAAATAVVAIAAAHAVMVAVMALTPVHMQDHGSDLEVIGLTISLHIAGMYALSPVMGWLADAWGPARTILLGQVVLVAAVAVAGTSGHSDLQITVGLVLLGVGWSASVIAGAVLLTRSVADDVRTPLQGFSDMAMSLSGATGGLLAGLVVAWQGFAVLNAAAGLLVVPVIVLVLAGRRTARQVSGGTP